MFTLPNIPSVDLRFPGRVNPVELADFWEILCLRSSRGIASLEDVKHAIVRPGDEDPEEDIEDDIELEGALDSAIAEVRDRRASCGGEPDAYPFQLNEESCRILSINLELSARACLYVFLLLATRLNMNSHRLQGNEDGTLLFEELCEIALGSVFGKQRKALRFGASRAGGSFAVRMEELCRLLGEGRSKQNVPYQQDSGDDGLDIAAWSPYADRRRGQMILFAQCKTGVSWKTEDLTRLKPERFCRLWMDPQPLLCPQESFMCALRWGSHKWERSGYGGLFFDRCRILEYVAAVPAELLARIRAWVEAGMASVAFSGAAM